MEQAGIPRRYKLLHEVGQGGMAVVYRAQDHTLNREVAIKILHHHLSTEPESKARLQREAQAVAQLHHENILEIFDYSGLESESSYIVTEFIDGQTLKQWAAAQSLAHPEVAALIAVEIGGALAHAHSLGIIHRDIKPENVMIRKDGMLKLMDFGIAQVVDWQRMTVTGQLLGSPAYMAPELIEGRPLDFRTDVFSVGIMLYQLATGSLPFFGKNPHEVLRRIGDGKFPDPRTLNRRIGDGLARIMSRALARNPDDRYPEIGQLVTDLTEYLAEGGLVETRAELRAYFHEPAGYTKDLPARLATGLVAAADRHLGDGRPARAMEAWNRVLSFDPEHRGVLAALHRLEGRARLKNASLAVVGLAALVGAAFGIARLYATRAPATPVATGPLATPHPPEPQMTLAPPFDPTATPDKPSAPRPTARPPTRQQAGAEGAPRAAGTGQSRTFTLGPTPQNVDVYLNGEKQFAYDMDHKSITVPWNTNHVIEFRSPTGCCFVEKVEIGPDRAIPADNIIARRLKWKPARLLVTTDPELPEARIMVKDHSRGGPGTSAKPGQDIDVPFFATDEPSKEVEVGVDTGESFTSERVVVRAGQRMSHVVKLKANN